MIAVTGATGNVGAALSGTRGPLLPPGYANRAATRASGVARTLREWPVAHADAAR